jgi:tRNA nucleotidyltransferase (CCA-adding enzyme)
LTPETREVLDALRAAGGRPLIVGGAVRDGLLSRIGGATVDSMDVDIEVYGLSKKEVWKALPGQGQEFGQNFGVFNTTLNGQDFDVILPRRDSKTGDGHRGFVVETDPEMSFEGRRRPTPRRSNTMGGSPQEGTPKPGSNRPGTS